MFFAQNRVKEGQTLLEVVPSSSRYDKLHFRDWMFFGDSWFIEIMIENKIVYLLLVCRFFGFETIFRFNITNFSLNDLTNRE